jgi:hypothetical protein
MSLPVDINYKCAPNKCGGFDPFSFFPLESLILSAKLN